MTMETTATASQLEEIEAERNDLPSSVGAGTRALEDMTEEEGEAALAKYRRGVEATLEARNALNERGREEQVDQRHSG